MTLGRSRASTSLDERGVLDVAHDRRQRQLREAVGERGLDRVDRGLGQVEQHELRRAEPGDVPAELGADRASCAGDHHTRLPSHSPSPALSSTTGSRPSRSSSSIVRIVVSAERPLIRSSNDGTVSTSIPASAQISATRRRTPCAAEGSATITWRTPYFFAHAGRLEIGPSTLTSCRSRPCFAGSSSIEPDDAPLPAPRELAGEARARFARADHEHRLAERRERAVQAVLLPDPVGEAIARHQEDEHDRIEDQHAARHDRLQPQHHEDQRDQQRAQSRGEHDPLQVEDAREAPQAAIEAEGDEDRRLQRQDPDERARHVGEERLVEIQAEAEPVHRGPCERGRAEVVDEGEPRAEIVGLRHCCSWRAPAPMIVNAGKQGADRDDPRGKHPPARARRRRQREQRRRRRADDQDAVEQQRAAMPRPHSVQPLIIMRSVRFEKMIAAREAPQHRHRGIGARTAGTRAAETMPGHISARMPEKPKTAARKPRPTDPPSPMNVARGRQVDDEKHERGRGERETGRPRSRPARAAATP